MSELLLCPFCGSSDVREVKKTMTCQCGAQGPYDTEDNVAAWNTRAARPDREGLRAAAERVVWFDWSGNDEDACKAIDDLRRHLEQELKGGDK